MVLSDEPHHVKTCFLLYAKRKAQISCMVTSQLISVFISATLIVQSFHFLTANLKPVAIFCGCTARFVQTWSETQKTGFLVLQLRLFKFNCLLLKLILTSSPASLQTKQTLQSIHCQGELRALAASSSL